MKKQILFTVFVMIGASFHQLSGQDTLKAMIAGTWFCFENIPIQFADTLVLQKDFEGNTFNMWEFKADETLKNSSGSIRENNKNAKCFNRVILYKWQLKKAPNNNSILQMIILIK